IIEQDHAGLGLNIKEGVKEIHPLLRTSLERFSATKRYLGLMNQEFDGKTLETLVVNVDKDASRATVTVKVERPLNMITDKLLEELPAVLNRLNELKLKETDIQMGGRDDVGLAGADVLKSIRQAPHAAAIFRYFEKALACKNALIKYATANPTTWVGQGVHYGGGLEFPLAVRLAGGNFVLVSFEKRDRKTGEIVEKTGCGQVETKNVGGPSTFGGIAALADVFVGSGVPDGLKRAIKMNIFGKGYTATDEMVEGIAKFVKPNKTEAAIAGSFERKTEPLNIVNLTDDVRHFLASQATRIKNERRELEEDWRSGNVSDTEALYKSAQLRGQMGVDLCYQQFDRYSDRSERDRYAAAVGAILMSSPAAQALMDKNVFRVPGGGDIVSQLKTLNENEKKDLIFPPFLKGEEVETFLNEN
ncbi:MAG: hypothetical protein K940chlam3_01768, partial [Chlamydiae bacterium]|nr:hypothetical protein [Chlamydiota bacterium]